MVTKLYNGTRLISADILVERREQKALERTVDANGCDYIHIYTS